MQQTEPLNGIPNEMGTLSDSFLLEVVTGWGTSSVGLDGKFLSLCPSA